MNNLNFILPNKKSINYHPTKYSNFSSKKFAILISKFDTINMFQKDNFEKIFA